MVKVIDTGSMIMTEATRNQPLECRYLSIAYVPIVSLRPYARNSRTHTKRQLKMIADSIKAFGFTNPVLTDTKDTIIAGHGRVEAAKLLGMEAVPTVRLESLTDDQIRAYVIADNRLAEKAGWDRSILASSCSICSRSTKASTSQSRASRFRRLT